MDTAAAFYPWYAFLGATLRSGAIPVWNPHQFSGTPFAADPESGWMYLPAMLLFSVFDLQLAAASYLVAHALLAGLSTYWLARTFGLSAAWQRAGRCRVRGSGFFLGHNVCCFAYASVAAWLPTAIVGVERATRSSSWHTRATVVGGCWSRPEPDPGGVDWPGCVLRNARRGQFSCLQDVPGSASAARDAWLEVEGPDAARRWRGGVRVRTRRRWTAAQARVQRPVEPARWLSTSGVWTS